jgi:Pentapeptide repeats (8 copies)
VNGAHRECCFHPQFIGSRYDDAGNGWLEKVEDLMAGKRDWLAILIIPLLLAVIGAGVAAWFNAQQDERQREIDEQRAQDAALQAYLDQMNQWLLEKKLSDPKVQTLARARTLTVLKRLNSSRKTEVMGFLEEASLIQSEDGRDPTISLEDSSLAGVDLKGATLDGAWLSGANLSNADLSYTSMRGTTLIEANLSNTDLSEADLPIANLGLPRLHGQFAFRPQHLLSVQPLRTLRGSDVPRRSVVSWCCRSPRCTRRSHFSLCAE